MPLFPGLTSLVRAAANTTSTRISLFRRNTGGGVAAVVAILSPVFIGAMGLGSETSYWYLTQRKVQNAADVSVHAATLRKFRGDDAANVRSMAEYVAANSDLDMAESVMTINDPPASGALAGDTTAVEVIIVRTVPRMFSAIYDDTPVDITGRAVAAFDGGGPGCIIALSDTTQEAINIGGSADINLDGCDMVSNAAGISFDMDGGGGSVNARCIQTVGTAQTTNSLTTECARLREFSPPAPDPYGSVAEPVPNGACSSSNVGQNNQTTNVSPNSLHSSGMMSRRYCNGLTLRGTVNFDPGIYFIEGGAFQVNANSQINGTGVIFFLADGVEITFNGTADFDISAPTTGPYAGILIFGSRSATTMTHRINGDAGVTMDGAIYTPESHLEFIGNTATSAVSCTQIIGDTVGFSGNGSIAIECSNTAGNDAHTGLQVRLWE